MARSEINTCIPLDRAAFYLGINPYHFNGIETTNMKLVNTCDDDWYQYTYQTSGKVSREDLAAALRAAEDSFSLYTNWELLPRWHTHTIPVASFYKPEVASHYNARLAYRSAETNYAYVRELGQKTSEIIDTPTISWEDLDGDSFNETARISFATTVTDVQELRCYYPGKGGLDTWEIRPLSSVTISGGTATIDIPRYLLALWELQIAMPTPNDPSIIIDGDDDSNFLETIEVRRVYSDPDTVLQVIFPPESQCSSDCSKTYDTSCAYIRNERLGFVAWKPTFDVSFAVPPEVKIYYRAGWVDPRLERPMTTIDPFLERAVVYYALSKLNQKVCGCTLTRQIWELQTTDIALREPDGTSYSALWQDLGSPFGTTKAGQDLWKMIRNLKVQKTPYRSA